MLKKVIAGFLVLATSTLFGMSLSQLNSASKSELMEINGIGDVKAAKCKADEDRLAQSVSKESPCYPPEKK